MVCREWDAAGVQWAPPTHTSTAGRYSTYTYTFYSTHILTDLAEARGLSFYVNRSACRNPRSRLVSRVPWPYTVL